MKIRTDFVTNSSSSSYVVEISVKAKDGKKYDVKFAPHDGNVNINCRATDIMESSSVRYLVSLLSQCMVYDLGGVNAGWDDDDGFYTEDLTIKYKERMALFGEKLQCGVKSMDEIDTITLTRRWNASGEAASCFGTNVDYYVAGLYDLADKVCTLKGKEKEAAKAELKQFLDDFDLSVEGEWGGRFPSGFLGAKVKGHIVWDKLDNDLERFAEVVFGQDLPDNDHAVETTVIDMKEKKITQTADYILIPD